MLFAKNNRKISLTPTLKWVLGYIASLLCAIGLGYFWRVFFAYNKISSLALTLLLCAFQSVIFICIFAISHFVKSFDLRAAIAVFLLGTVFVFVTPPLQVPDENVYFMRAYSMSEGHFDFDAEREYPNDVNNLLSHFSFAWVKAHNHNPITHTEGVADAIIDYHNNIAEGTQYSVVKEPVMFMILPFIPQAVGIFIAKLLGFTALGAMYGGRLVNLLFYTVCCYFAFKNCKRYKSVFVAVALLPLCLFIAGSNSYDAGLLGLSYFVISYYCKDKITDKDMLLFYAAFAYLCAVKANNLLFLVFPLCLPPTAWKCKYKKWQSVLLALASAGALMLCFEAYSRAFMHNYGTIARMIDGVAPMEQLKFVFSNIPRFCAITLGTLYENSFFVFDMGKFGNIDLILPLVSGGSVVMLMLSASLSVHEKSTLNTKSSLGLFGISCTYIASVLAAMYITYTPLYMAKIIGIQPRYFLPAFLMLTILLCALLSRVMYVKRETYKSAELLCLCCASAFALFSVISIFQSYYIGPVAGN